MDGHAESVNDRSSRLTIRRHNVYGMSCTCRRLGGFSCVVVGAHPLARGPPPGRAQTHPWLCGSSFSGPTTDEKEHFPLIRTQDGPVIIYSRRAISSDKARHVQSGVRIFWLSSSGDAGYYVTPNDPGYSVEMKPESLDRYSYPGESGVSWWRTEEALPVINNDVKWED